MKKFFSLLVMLVAVGGFSLGCEGGDTSTPTEDTTSPAETDTADGADADTADPAAADADDAGSAE